MDYLHFLNMIGQVDHLGDLGDIVMDDQGEQDSMDMEEVVEQFSER